MFVKFTISPESPVCTTVSHRFTSPHFFSCFSAGILHQVFKISANYIIFPSQFRQKKKKWGEQGNLTQQHQKQLSSDLLLCEKQQKCRGWGPKDHGARWQLKHQQPDLSLSFRESAAEGSCCTVIGKEIQAWNNLSLFMALRVLHIFPFLSKTKLGNRFLWAKHLMWQI